MITIETKIQNGVGIHARPASQIVGEANKYKSSIIIEFDEKKINAKSMMSLLASGIKSDVNLILSCDGEDETEASNALISILKSIKE